MGHRLPAAVRCSSPADPSWRSDAARMLARVGRAAGDDALRLDHIGSTAVPGLPAKDVLDLQLVVADLAVARRLAPQLARAGFVPVPGVDDDNPHPGHDDPARRRKTFHANADPGRAVNLHVRPVDGPAWRWALAFRDWLTDDTAACAEYLEYKRDLAARHAGDADTDGYAAAKEAWFAAAAPRLQAWTERIGWVPG